MKMVTAMIQPFKLQEVTLEMAAVPGFRGMTVSDAKGFGRENPDQLPEKLESLTDFKPCVRVEMVVDDRLLDTVVKRLWRAAHTGRKGDGIVIVRDVEELYSIRKPPGEL